MSPHPASQTTGEFEFGELAQVVRERREQHGFLLTAWVFPPDHWHAIVFACFPLSISRVMEAIKVRSTFRINCARRQRGLLWQSRFFDRALRTVKEYSEKVEYIHRNLIRARLVQRLKDRHSSSVREYSGTLRVEVMRHATVPVHSFQLPTDERGPI